MNGSGLFSTRGPLKPHLVQGKGGVAGEVDDLRKDVGAAMVAMAAITVDEHTNLAAADPDAIKTTFSSVASAVEYTGDDLDGLIGGSEMVPARNIDVTNLGTGTPADAPATLTVTGIGPDGNEHTEDISVPQTAATTAGLRLFSKVTKLAFTAGDGTAAELTVGFGDRVGTLKKPIFRTGATSITPLIHELYDGGVVTNGTIGKNAWGVDPDFWGEYAPNTAPDGAHDYALYYEYDPTA